MTKTTMSSRVLTTGLMLLAALLVSSPATAAIDTYQFQDEQSRQQFMQLTQELRCPKCQNQNLADSNSPIAADMRREIHRLLEDGQSSDQVVNFMVARYGDFVRYRPKQDSSTAVLWYGPIALLVVGLTVVVLISRRRASGVKKKVPLADDEQQRLQALLAENKSSEQSATAPQQAAKTDKGE